MNKTQGVTLNKKTTPKMFVFVSVLILISLACNLPSMAKTAGSQDTARQVETSIAETLEARKQGDGQDQGAEGDDNAAPPASDTPEVTDTPSLTPTITDTPTPEVAMIYSSANTNCRVGPGTSFAAIYTVNEGTEVEAVAQGPYGEFWYIKHPDQPSTICAMWSKYATPSGPYELLPIWTPMPTPTPKGLDFTISYHKYLDCGGPWGVQYRIDNIGSKTLESWTSSVTDHTGGSNPQVWTDDKFYDYSTCVSTGVQEDLTTGEAYYVFSYFFGDPKNHKITSHIKLCAKNGLGGECKTKNYKHKP